MISECNRSKSGPQKSNVIRAQRLELQLFNNFPTVYTFDSHRFTKVIYTNPTLVLVFSQRTQYKQVKPGVFVDYSRPRTLCKSSPVLFSLGPPRYFRHSQGQEFRVRVNIIFMFFLFFFILHAFRTISTLHSSKYILYGYEK